MGEDTRAPGASQPAVDPAVRPGYLLGVPARQLRLFPHPRPLLERLGPEFFRAVPARPGVYIMSGETDRVLYVGQSQNLRQRLATYKNAHPDHLPRKIIRLVHAVRQITWEECETALQARLRENELLRTHRPKFNDANTYPRAYCFLGLAVAGVGLTLSLTTDPNAALQFDAPPPEPKSPDPEGGLELLPISPRKGEPTVGLAPVAYYGAFKSGGVRGYAALLRLLWAAIHPSGSPADWPRPLLRFKPPRQFTFQLGPGAPRSDLRPWVDALRQFLSGISPGLLDRLSSALGPPEQLAPFHRAMQIADLEMLTGFYENGPRRNHELRTFSGLPGAVIPQERLDDLLVASRRWREARRAAASATPIPSPLPAATGG